jgi:hypothetical protein
MIKKVIESIDITSENAEKVFVGKEKVVMVEGINIKISLTKKGFDGIK